METTKIIGSFFRDILSRLDDNARQDLENIISGGNAVAVEHFIEEHNVSHFLRDSQGNTMLHLFMESLFPKKIEPLLKKGLSVNALNDKGETPLHSGCKAACVSHLKLLLDHGADLFALTYNGDTCLHVAAKYGSEQVINFLLENGMPVNVINKQGNTALDIAVENEEFEIAALISQTAAA